MGNGASTGQGGNPTRGTRDVREEADIEQSNWPELAVAPNTNRTVQPSPAATQQQEAYDSYSNKQNAQR